jgi:hypothetical protein
MDGLAQEFLCRLQQRYSAQRLPTVDITLRYVSQGYIEGSPYVVSDY